MLLQRLAEYATSLAESTASFHRDRVYHWQLELAADGTLRSTELSPLTTTDDRGRARGVVHPTPSVVRTVGVAANLAADDMQYVLGWGEVGTNADRVGLCHAAFADLTLRWADSDAGRDDPVAQAVAAFYRGGGATAVTRPPEYTAKQGVVIAVDGVLAYRAPSVPSFWTSEVSARKGGGTSGLCLVCGMSGPLLDTVPGKVRAALIPGATNDAALVSINERVFGYDLTTQLGHTPLCLTCGEAVAAGLLGVLDSPHSISYGDQDSRMAWWVTEPSEFDAMEMLQRPDPDQVTAWLRAARAGERRPGNRRVKRDSPKFCSLTVGGNVARVMVRDWVEMPLPDLHTNIEAWLNDHEIASRWDDAKRHHGLSQLLLAAGRWQRDRNGYADFAVKGADRPRYAQRDLLRAAIRGVPIPLSLLAHVVRRVQTDGRLDEPRAALIRLALTRSPLTTEKLMPDLDPTNTDPAYVAGRAFAVLEQIQYDASGGKLNTTYGDRYFAGAVSNPRAAVVNGRKDANAWLKKLRRDGKAFWHEQILDELFTLVDADPGIPSRTTLRQQASFLLGYHHQRAHRSAAIRTRKQTTNDTTEETV